MNERSRILASRPSHDAFMEAAEAICELPGDEDDDVGGLATRIRGKERDYPPDPAVWLEANKMTQTEVSLRLARYLIAERMVASDVDVALTGYELTRQERPRFPVVRYLTERDFVRRSRSKDWRGDYKLNGAEHALHLHSQEDAGDVVATLVSGRRLVAHVSRGVLDATRSPAEHKLLRGALARTLTFAAERSDVLAAAVPRSKRFRELAVRWRVAEGTIRAGILILTVDRLGVVDGFPRDDQR
jgi:hypothetical protein